MFFKYSINISERLGITIEGEIEADSIEDVIGTDIRTKDILGENSWHICCLKEDDIKGNYIMNWNDVIIDFNDFETIEKEVENHKNYNPACNLITYWTDRINNKITKEARTMGKLGYGYVGDGWPIESDQSYALEHDKRNLKKAFNKHNYRDVGDAIYQCNTILDNIDSSKKINVMDFGGGYGRLSIPFIRHLKGKLTYFSVEYVPISLLIAPQFVKQVSGANTVGWNYNGINYDMYDFVSLPSWKLDEIKHDVDVFVSVHSFQEMEAQTVDFYIDTTNRLSKKGSIFYSINLPGHGDKVVKMSSDWKLIKDEAYPINRDGSFNQKIWRRK